MIYKNNLVLETCILLGKPTNSYLILTPFIPNLHHVHKFPLTIPHVQLKLEHFKAIFNLLSLHLET